MDNDDERGIVHRVIVDRRMIKKSLDFSSVLIWGSDDERVKNL